MISKIRKSKSCQNALVWMFLCLSISISLSSCDKDDIEDDLENEWNNGNSNSNNNEPGGTQNTYEGSVNGHEFVDLGLSVKWAKCNLGASSSSDYGNYYAWAETITKLSYWPDNYKFYNTKTGTYSAPTTSICGTKYDAATYYWGSKWRMPSQKEAQELIDKCTWKETSVNGVVGYQVTGRNGKSIFLPKAGSFTGNEKGAKAGIFFQMWTGTYAKQSDFYFHAYSLEVSNARKDVSGASVYDGISIRPVTTAEGDSQSGGSGNNSGGGSSGSGDVEDFYETNFSSTEYTNKITVNFYFSDRVSSATIKYGTTSSCSSSKTATVSAKSAYATITGLKPGTKYYFKCVAKSKSGQSCTTSTYPVMTNYN